MSKRPDPQQVLRYLAETLDPSSTLERFPPLTRDGLSEILRRASALMPGAAAEGVLRVDGAARGNPGPAGAGFVLEGSGGVLYRGGEYLGEATNNVAEYSALLEGMGRAAALGVRRLRVLSDSELMVKQLNGLYRVKSPALQELYFQAVKAAQGFERVTYEHVKREENREADRLANMAIDAKGPVEL